MFRHLILASLLGLLASHARAQTAVPATDTTSGSADTDDDWWRRIRLEAFVDAYYLADWNLPAAPTANSAGIAHRAFDRNQGFGLSFAGLGIAYEGEDVGATLDLRFGGAQAALIGAPVAEFVALKEAYASWRPMEGLQLDVGQFDTLYGVESADSWRNANYTRGALYFLQPFYHFGGRLTYEAEAFTLRAMVVNGTNLAVVDNNQSPHVGVQVLFPLGDAAELALGYYTGASASGYGAAAAAVDDDQWEHFVDAVLTATLVGRLRLTVNGSVYVSAPGDAALFYGLAAPAALDVTESFALALRGALVGDTEALVTLGQYERLGTVTATLDYHPSKHVYIRLDTRLEVADRDLYTDRDTADDGTLRRTYLSSTLGFVVTTD